MAEGSQETGRPNKVKKVEYTKVGRKHSQEMGFISGSSKVKWQLDKHLGGGLGTVMPWWPSAHPKGPMDAEA